MLSDDREGYIANLRGQQGERIPGFEEIQFLGRRAEQTTSETVYIRLSKIDQINLRQNEITHDGKVMTMDPGWILILMDALKETPNAD